MLDRSTLDLANEAAPDWVGELRTRGFEAFEQLPMPSEQEEVWRYVDLDFDLADFDLAAGPGDPLPADAALAAAMGDAPGRASVVDGFTLDVEHEAGDGVAFSSLERAAADHEGMLRGALGQGVPPDLDKFAALHHAFSRDGIFLHVPKGRAIPGDFHVDLQASGPGLSLPRVTVVVEEGAEAGMVISLRSPPDGDCLVVPQVEVAVGDNARFRLTTFQEYGRATRGIAHQRLVAGRDATVRFGEVGVGARLSRLHLTVDLAGRGSNADVSGAYFGDGDQILDYRYFMNHAAPNTDSNMFLKGAVEDQAVSVFTGLIRIEEEAQKTNAFPTNRNLVLSSEAMANSVPNLEILANDVRCGHGSTMGPLDAEQRYYLMSRGLDRARADRLQVRGFFEQAVRRLPAPELAGVVRERLNAKFVAAQEEGRV